MTPIRFTFTHDVAAPPSWVYRLNVDPLLAREVLPSARSLAITAGTVGEPGVTYRLPRTLQTMWGGPTFTLLAADGNSRSMTEMKLSFQRWHITETVTPNGAGSHLETVLELQLPPWWALPWVDWAVWRVLGPSYKKSVRATLKRSALEQGEAYVAYSGR
jgi:hypothetical protein